MSSLPTDDVFRSGRRLGHSVRCAGAPFRIWFDDTNFSKHMPVLHLLQQPWADTLPEWHSRKLRNKWVNGSWFMVRGSWHIVKKGSWARRLPPFLLLLLFRVVGVFRNDCQGNIQAKTQTPPGTKHPLRDDTGHCRNQCMEIEQGGK